MLNHIFELSKRYDLYICCNNASKLKKKVPRNVSLININYKRGLSLFHDLFTFLITLFYILKIRPYLAISFTPKVGLIVSIASLFTRTPKYFHWYTGQIWANSKGLKVFFKFTDKLIFFFQIKSLSTAFHKKLFD